MGCHLVVGANSFALIALDANFDSRRLKSPLPNTSEFII